MRIHIFVSVIVDMTDHPVEYEISDGRENKEQDRNLVHLEHEDKRAHARYCSENSLKYGIHRLNQACVGFLHSKSVFVVEIAVFETL